VTTVDDIRTRYAGPPPPVDTIWADLRTVIAAYDDAQARLAETQTLLMSTVRDYSLMEQQRNAYRDHAGELAEQLTSIRKGPAGVRRS
jgi:hypothetical protein